MVGGNERIISTPETNRIQKLRNVKSLSIIEMSKQTGFCLELKGNMQMRNTYLKKDASEFPSRFFTKKKWDFSSPASYIAQPKIVQSLFL